MILEEDQYYLRLNSTNVNTVLNNDETIQIGANDNISVIPENNLEHAISSQVPINVMNNVNNLNEDDTLSKFTSYSHEVEFCKIVQNNLSNDTNITKFVEDKSMYGNQLLGDGKKLIVMNIDGCKSSEKCISILTSEMYSPKHFNFLGYYVFNDEQDNEYNYSNKKDTVLTVFSGIFAGIENTSNFLIENLKSNTEFEQLLQLATLNNAHHLVTSYESLKGPLASNKLQDANLSSMLLVSKIPIIVMKEFNTRKMKNTKGYSWFVVLDHSYINCFKAFTTFSHLIDKEKDSIFAFGLYPSYITYDVYQKQFLEYCQNYGFKNYSYESDSYVKSASALVLEKINYESKQFDFMIFYNNCEKYQIKRENSESWKLLKKAQANICFINNTYQFQEVHENSNYKL